MNFLRPTSYRARYPRWMVGRPLLIASSALCSLGDAMFGYSQGCISTALVQPSFIRRMYGVQDVTLEKIAKGDTEVNEYLIGITVACLNVTAFFAALTASTVCDKMGRRASMRIGSFFCFVAAIMQVFAPNLAVLITGRSIQGIGVGFLSMTVPVIQAEIAPGHARGVFITIENLFLNAGYSLSTWVGYAFYFYMPSEISWRGSYIVFSSIALVLLTGTYFLPETPRWLIKNGFHEEGLATLADLQSDGNPDSDAVRDTYKEIVAAIEFEKALGGDCTWTQLFTEYTRRTVMGITSQMFAQLNGINAILYFLPENLLRAGFDIPQALLYTGASSTMLVAGIIPTLFLVDSWGRRPILIVGGVGMMLCLIAVGGLQYHVDKLSDLSPELASAANGIFASVCLYLAFFAFSWGPIPWLIPAEVFPLRARARGMALATGSNWLWNFIVAFATPPIFGAIRGGSYFIIAGFVFISIMLVIFVYRETAHKTLEELSEVFGEKALVNVTAVMVPDMSQARMVMRTSNRVRSMSASRSAVGMGMGSGMGMTGGVAESGIGGAPVYQSRSTAQLEKGLSPKSLKIRTSDDSALRLGSPRGKSDGRLSVGGGAGTVVGGNSAMTSQATLAEDGMGSEKKEYGKD